MPELYRFEQQVLGHETFTCRPLSVALLSSLSAGTEVRCTSPWHGARDSDNQLLLDSGASWGCACTFVIMVMPGVLVACSLRRFGFG